MKRLLNFFVILAFATGCGKAFEVDEQGVYWGPQTPEEELFEKALDKASDEEPPLEGEIHNLEALSGKDYVVKNERQKFTLSRLGHLVYSSFECKTEFEVNNKKTKATLEVRFFPEVTISSLDKDIPPLADSEISCGHKAAQGQKIMKSVGGLVRDKDEDLYILTHTLHTPDQVILSMKWPADQSTEGEIQCRTRSGEILLKGVISSCVLNTKPLN